MNQTTFTPQRFWDTKTILLTLSLTILLVSFGAYAITTYLRTVGTVYKVNASIEVHSTIYQYRDGKLIYTYHHPGVTTIIGENFTAAKILGEGFDTTNASLNVTFVSMGAYTSISNATTTLPNQWNISTTITPELLGAGNWNLSFSFYPSGSGSTNCTGLNWDGTGTGSLWAYDTFTTITYTSNDQIDVEWEVDISYS